MLKDKKCLGLRMDYDIRVDLGKKGCAPISGFAMAGDYTLPLFVLVGIGIAVAGTVGIRCLSFHLKYRKRKE